MKSQDVDKAVDEFGKGQVQAQAEAKNNPGAIGTQSGALDESVVPTTPSLEAAKKAARGGK